MDLEQLTGRYARLKQELAAAYKSEPWHRGRIDRLANELSVTEHQIAAIQAREMRQQDAALSFS